ncbi:MAG TPA: YchJ family metal-binding protein [Steroidobacteraceae bacterium]|jgi:SEC-C motif-containing protein
MPLAPALPCPCASGIAINLCCGRWHAGEPAPNAEAVMRSRYTAFVVNNEPYLLATWHASTRPASVPFDSKQKWLGLKIVDAKVADANTAEVEFIARYRIGGGSAARHHERSRFMRDAGRWLYVDGDVVKRIGDPD